jgi:regulator of protease activity HflC (stomatin/prohibitin superfamily)
MTPFALAGVALIIVVLVYISGTTVNEFESGLKYTRGRYVGALGPGRYRINPVVSHLEVVDTRLRTLTVPGQEVLSSDRVTLKVSLAVRYRVVDPALAIHGFESFELALYQHLQVALRGIVGAAPISQLLERRAELGRQLHESAERQAAAMGLDLESADIKDIMFPGETKKIFAEVVKARQDGLAALERARGETAALRHLANAAELLDKKPTLLTLRSLQALSESTNATLVLGVPNDGTQNIAVTSPGSPTQP